MEVNMSSWSVWNPDLVRPSTVSIEGLQFENFEESKVFGKDLQAIADKLKYYEERIYEEFSECIPVDLVKFKLKGAVAGKAYITDSIIDINADIFRENREEYLHRRTLGHEYAHIVNYHLLNGRGHDNNWHFVMKKLGLNSSRCHNYEISHLVHRHKRPYVYKCNCQIFKFTTRMHNSIKRGAWRRCNSCGVTLKFSHKES